MLKSEILKAHVADARRWNRMGHKKLSKNSMDNARKIKSGKLDSYIVAMHGPCAIDC